MPTLAAFAERYLAVQDATRSDYRNKVMNLRLHILPHLGHLPLDQVTRMEIDGLGARLRAGVGESATSRRTRERAEQGELPTTPRRKGGPRSPKTINNVLTTLRTVLGLAFEYELIARVPRIKMERVQKRDPGFLDEDEVARLLAAAPEEWRLVLLTAVRTGLRRGELMALRWSDLHLEAARPFLRVQRSVRREADGSLGVKEPKGGRPRSVPLTRDLLAELRAARPAAAGDDPELLVFPGPCAGFFDHQRLWKVVSGTARAAGLKKHAHPHLLRHTFASHCYQRGIPPQVVQQWMGHAQISTTERYAHLAPHAGEDLIDRLVPDRCAIRGNTRGNTTEGVETKNAAQGTLDSVP